MSLFPERDLGAQLADEELEDERECCSCNLYVCHKPDRDKPLARRKRHRSPSRTLGPS